MDRLLRFHSGARPTYVGIAALLGAFLAGGLLLGFSVSPTSVRADPISPPEGYPKFNTSVKLVTPTLAHADGPTLRYTIEIHNTGAYSASGTTVADEIPAHTTYNGDAEANVVPSQLNFADGVLTWTGDVGFDATVVISFSVRVDDAHAGVVRNTAVISHPLIAAPVTRTAETVVTDRPILAAEKASSPSRPGPNKPISYTLTVRNQGQPATSLPITATDRVPLNTTLLMVGEDGYASPTSDRVTWTREVTLDWGDTTEFTFSVDVEDVTSGTVVLNDDYRVSSPETGVTAGTPHTITVVDPILRLSKEIWPDPPGSNRSATYTLTLLNQGSLAADLVITDEVPSNVSYVSGGSEANGEVSWSISSLDTGESATFTYTVYISDVMGIAIVNADYGACSAEGVCQTGEVLTSIVRGPTFEVDAALDPIAKKPGGGGGPVTPTLVLHNLGPGNAAAARASIKFERISVSNVDSLEAMPDIGGFTEGAGCGDKCYAYVWVGNLNHGEAVTFTTTLKEDNRGRSTIGGSEGTLVTATVAVTDSLSNAQTEPVSDTANSKITHFAQLNPAKSATRVVGRGQTMTYTISVWNSALATDEPPYPYLWDVLPIEHATVLTGSISHGGRIETVTLSSTAGITTRAQAISWTLPALGTGERIEPRTFAVRVDDQAVSGTQIVNDPYTVHWYETEEVTMVLPSGEVITLTGWFSNSGQPVTTTVKEVGLIDSYKEVTPTLAPPGPGNVLTYFLHIVNSAPLTATDVTIYDYLPWRSTTYQRDAVASGGEVVSDIVSIEWTGDVAPLSSEILTFTSLVDHDYQGAVTNTAVISNPDLLSDVEVDAVAYVTEKPVLDITKRGEIVTGDSVRYTIRLLNRGQRATGLRVTDTVPANTTYIPESATGGGEWRDGQLEWDVTVLEPAGSKRLQFEVEVNRGIEVVNAQYGVTCAEGVSATGSPVVTRVPGGGELYLPLILRNYP